MAAEAFPAARPNVRLLPGGRPLVYLEVGGAHEALVAVIRNYMFDEAASGFSVRKFDFEEFNLR